MTIGSDIESLVYAYLNDNYFLPTLAFGPMFYEKLRFPVLNNDRQDFTWSRIQLIMSLSGRLLNYEEINTVRVLSGEIKISTSNGLKKYTFNTCNIFDPTGVQVENEIEKRLSTLYRVYDDFVLSNLGGKHAYLPPKKTKDSLAKEIHYYISDRVDGANYVTDCVAESLLTREQLNDVDYSDSITRFAVSRHLTSLGIHGTFMNLYKNGTPKYRKPKITHKKRVVLEKERNKYKDSDKVKFLDLSMEEIVNEFSP